MRYYCSPSLYQEDWFIDLDVKHKSLWNFINVHANAAGIWTPNFKAASLLLGVRVMNKDLDTFGKKIRRLESGNILIIGFATQQFGKITSKHGIHSTILNIVSAEGLEVNDLDRYPIGRDKIPPEKEKEKEKEKAKEKESFVLEKECEKKPFQKPAVKSKVDYVIPAALESHVEFLVEWRRWVSHLTKKKGVPTSEVLEEHLGQLEKLGPEKGIAAIKHSISGNCGRIYEPWEQTNGKSYGKSVNGKPAEPPAEGKEWVQDTDGVWFQRKIGWDPVEAEANANPF